MDSLLKGLLTVHYFLIATALVAIVSSFAFTTTQLQIAREDLASLQVWHEADTNGGRQNLLHRVHAISDQDFASMGSQDRFLQFLWEGKPRCVKVQGAFLWEAADPETSVSGVTKDETRAANSMTTARWNWDFMRDVFVVEPITFGTSVEVVNGTIAGAGGSALVLPSTKSERQTLPAAPLITTNCNGTMFLRARSSLKPPMDNLVAALVKFYTERRENKGVADFSLYIERVDDLGDNQNLGKVTHDVIVPMIATVHRIDAQEMLLESRQSRHAPGPFPSTFPELAKITEGLGNLSLSDTAKFVEALGKQVGDKVQIAQIDVPARSFGSWSAILILSLQSLFYMLVEQAHRRPPSAADLSASPWFPLFDGRFAKVATLITVLVLPSVSILLALRATLRLSSRFVECFVVVGVCAAAIALAIATYRLIRHLRTVANATTSAGSGLFSV